MKTLPLIISSASPNFWMTFRRNMSRCFSIVPRNSINFNAFRSHIQTKHEGQTHVIVLYVTMSVNQKSLKDSQINNVTYMYHTIPISAFFIIIRIRSFLFVTKTLSIGNDGFENRLLWYNFGLIDAILSFKTFLNFPQSGWNFRLMVRTLSNFHI